ncbi:MAG: beta-N-acetylhexosaminidase [Hoeflea sp.]|uniref:beta-N-acetylhexosaminidase n=1 Tax=Hoeflea sp. TaxID=1940281 RepID=UPI001D2B55CF|nr:beta-N-acetylhexosaminidase [Hoeflea sp.]MBU4530715.1 beta-N-acetylhexosaminidase [Alphaproteobacteria bacterium]MBU4544935.1 beta-N-acetylhexosaminidase [Alphaproteobacteria bacterium]MBU4552078.1 beta-N-acetylhexosaminidase [Alphaproteobacteria bacterium]MBV1722267.1 beta-N-acetylhexosaminidase [Hoeflea sp.]MBV1761829.1 beta-N-acetylhexosaminidase [Hoeflea sp.]
MGYHRRMSESKAVIFGCAGPELTSDEAAFFAEHRPWGFILFGRNIVSLSQVADLTASLRDCIGRPDAPVLIDQEGGRVQRFKPPLVPQYPSGADLGALYQVNPEAGLRATWIMSRLHAFDLYSLGITVDCLPVLDVPAPGGHEVIGSRAYGITPDVVAALGAAACEGLKAGGLLPVIKHIPGHGRAGADTHFELPRVDASWAELSLRDFAPFKALSGEAMAMSAHVVYSAIDPEHPATTSRRVIDEVIRAEIGFDGLLMSDDVSMNALSGDFAVRAGAIFAAGCDVTLHCNGNRAEMEAVASITPVLSGDSLRRAKAVMAAFRAPDLSDEIALRKEFEGLMAAS